jgi:hypothetical protein
VIVTVPAGATTGTVSVPTTADTIDEVDETFSIANGTVSATGTLSTITMHLLWQRSLLLRLPKDLMWYSTLPEQPFCSRDTYTFVLNKWYGWKCGLHDYKRDSNCSAGATTGTVSVPTTEAIDEVDETLALLGTASATGTIIDNNAVPTVATITPASATEGICGIQLH